MPKKLNFKIRFHTKDGEIGVIINGVKYVYYLDAGFIPEIVKKAKHAPGKALALLKETAHSYERR
jgi:hypothetical protein